MISNPQHKRRPLKVRSQKWVLPLALKLLSFGLTPNMISMAGLGAACLGFGIFGIAIYYPAYAGIVYVSAGFCIQLRLLCNLLDGIMAIEAGAQQKTGELFNEVPDRFADCLLFIGAGFAVDQEYGGWLCALFSLFTAYIRILGASLGLGHDFRGPFAKPQRMFILTFACWGQAAVIFFSSNIAILAFSLWVIAAGTLLTMGLRLLKLYHQLR